MRETLEATAQKCGELIMAMRTHGLETEDKDEARGAHYSTDADKESQALGIQMLTNEYPDISIVAEEQPNDPVIPAHCVVFDPADGTNNLFNGSADFGVALCEIRDGTPESAALYFPVDDVLYSASRGEGWFHNGEKQPPLVPWDRPLDKTILGTDIGPWTVYEVLQGITSAGFTVHSKMSGIVGFRSILDGVTGAYWNINIAKIWDKAAGALILTEAGGVICDHQGNDPTYARVNDGDWICGVNQELVGIPLHFSRNWEGRK